VRLGTAIVVAPLHHHAEIAEQAVLVDLLSNGRLELGLGAGYRLPEYQLFDASMDKRYAQTDETARQVRRLLSPGGVRPQPVQERLPIWMGYQGPQGARRAGLLGEALLSADARNWEPYREGLVDAGHDVSAGRMAGAVNAFVTDDPDRDWALVRDRLAHQLDTYNLHAVEGTDLPTPRPVDPERLRTNSPKRQNYFWCDTPAAVADEVRRYTAGAPVESVHLFVSLSGMPEDVVLRHLHTIAGGLRPALADVDAAAESPAPA
jgi:alkanesulfonate monooxygenase SsuD/methylene tetrahydromethanopterin reductase-like flavin-dependent oxidoreductase (luciferase family)